MPVRKLKGRYEIKDILGQGGMGVVYKAYDAVVKRDVAVKTLRDIPSPNALKLFQKECEVLASLSHPNIVEIFDIGEFEEEGERKPFLVMPLLPGTALDKLIHNSSQRLSVERSVEIITQACRGLHAAHEQGLVHRDLKPSNIFVLRDDSVKIIDFGVALMVDSRTTRGQKGTLLYMAPEQIEMKPLSALSDLFSLGVVCYETFTRRRPFERATEGEVAEAILRQFPPPASELNPAVSQSISRVVNKAMAKQPWHRFTSAREFAETLGKALRNEPIEFFDPARTQPRIQRAQNAFDQADYQFAGEILSELEAEGHLDPEIIELRRRIDQAVRQKTVRQLLESARTRFEQDEYPLALQKIQEVMQLDPENAAALGLKSTIETKRTERKIEDWFRLAHQHISNHAYSHARQALQNVLQIRPKESRALQMLAEVDRREQEYVKIHQQKEQTYKAALEAWHNGDISFALSKMGIVVELERQSPDTTSPERSTTYQNFYNQVRSEHDAMNSAHAEAQKHLAERDFPTALALCDQYLSKYPENALFQALRFDVEEQERQERSAFIAEVDRRVETEPDLAKRVGILEEALARYPGEGHFERSLRLMREKRDLVNSIVAKGRLYEERGQFAEALGQWEILRTIYRQFPGLDFEIERVVKRSDQQARIDARARATREIEQQLELGDYAKAIELAKEAQAEFPADSELVELENVSQQGMQRAAEVQRLLVQGQELCSQHQFEAGLEVLRKAFDLDDHNPATRAALSNALAERAHDLMESDWRVAQALIDQALDIDPGHALARSLYTLASDRKRQEFVDRCLSQARQLHSAGDLQGAQAEVERGLAAYPQEPRLKQRQASLSEEDAQTKSRMTRRQDLEQLRGLDREAGAASDPLAMQQMSERAERIAQRYPNDPEVQSLATGVGRRLETIAPRSDGATRVESPHSAAGSSGPVIIPPRALRPHPLGERASRSAQIAATAAVGAAPAGKLRFLLLAAGAVVVVVVGAILVQRLVSHRQAAVTETVASKGTAATFAVEINTSPAGARIRIDNQDRGISPLQVQLPEGTYQVEAQKDGYRSMPQSLSVKPGLPNSIDLSLQPLGQGIRVHTDLSAGEVLLDGKRVGEIQQGSDFPLDAIEAGKHRLKIRNGSQGEASIDFEAAPPDMGVISSVTAKHLKAVVISSQGALARVQSRPDRLKVGFDGKAPEEVGAGRDVSDLTPGSHTLVVTEGPEQRTLSFETGPSPMLSVFLDSGHSTGRPELISKRVHVSNPVTTAQPSTLTGTAVWEAEQLRSLENLARDAYVKKNYADPADQSTIAYAHRILKLRPDDEQGKWYLEHGIEESEHQVHAALSAKDFAHASRLTNALAQLLPGHKVIAGLQKDIAAAEKSSQAPPPKAVAPEVNYRVKHLHAKGYCEGEIAVTGQRVKFAGEAAEGHKIDLACSDIKGIRKEGGRFSSLLSLPGHHHDSGFSVRTASARYDFLPDDKSADAVVTGLNKACEK